MKRKKPIRRVSKKRAVEMKQYTALRKQFLAENPVCQVWLIEHGFKATRDPMCGWYESRLGICYSSKQVIDLRRAPLATDVHHVKGRGKHYLDVDSWLAVCRENHQRIHDNPSWARENGFLA